MLLTGLLEQTGPIFHADTGYQQISPANTLMEQSPGQFLKLAREFELSPASRPRVQVDMPSDKRVPVYFI
jgi:hypothetical protein